MKQNLAAPALKISLRDQISEPNNSLRKTLPQIFAEGGVFYDRHQQNMSAVRAAFEDEA